MPKYKYIGMDSKGRETSGEIDADSRARAMSLIKQKGLFPTSVEEAGGRRKATPPRSGARRGSGSSGGKGKAGLQTEIKLPSFMRARVKPKHLSVFTRQLAITLDAGLPLLRGLRTLHKQERHPSLREALEGMGEAVESGTTFSEALSQYPRVFNKLYINMVKAGEAGGILDGILARLADFMEKGERIRNRVRGAMVYPLVVLFMSVAILVFLMLVIIPRFRDIFDDLLEGRPLPQLTRIVIGISESLASWPRMLTLIGVIVVLVVGTKLARRTAKGAYLMDALKLRMPIFGGLLRKAAIARFARTLGTLMTSGVPVLQALNIVKETSGNEVIARAISSVHDSVKEGDTMADPLSASGVFPDIVISMVDVGEETGALPEMLVKIADAYEDEVDTAVEGLTSVVEPLMIVFLAVVVGTIVIAMFLPLIEIIKNLGG